MLYYIRALGFSDYKEFEDVNDIINEILENPTEKYVSDTKEGYKIEYYKSYGKNFGLAVRGETDKNGNLVVRALYPMAKGRNPMEADKVDISGSDKKELFYIGYFEESISKTPLSFFLQNMMEYDYIEDEEDAFVESVSLTAFAAEATVLLPVSRDEEKEDEKKKFLEYFLNTDLLEKAKDGDMEAIDELEDEALKASMKLHERLKEEDILTVFEGFFVAVGEQEDLYSVLGYIEDFSKLLNRKTKEYVYRMKIRCMNVICDVYVNEKDLLGVPKKGMRLKSTAWVQGYIDFSYEDFEELNEID